MAFDFFKKGLFKKHKEEIQHKNIEEIKVEITEEKEPTVPVYVTQEEKENAIMERITISSNSPMKLLWNVYNNKSGADFKPLEYILKPIIETNTKLNEISESDEYVSFDENQQEFLIFLKRVQSSCIKYLKDIIKESVNESLDDFSKDIEIHDFEAILKETTDYGTYEELKYNCEKDKKSGRKKPFDSQIIIYTTKDRIHAWMMIIPALNGGKELTEDDVNKHLFDNSVISGIDKTLISAICQKKKFLQIFEVARGTEVVHGKDGFIVDKFSRSNTINIREDEHGNLNYKELNNVNSVHANDVICDIVYPVEGVDGQRIDGKTVTARQGKNPKIPQGKNTGLTEDKSQLITLKDGELVFKDGVFLVNELLTIENDVDNASGNINFAGDVLIKGDVREGFSVKAEGNITILGTAEGADIVSASNVIIKHGMTGGGG